MLKKKDVERKKMLKEKSVEMLKKGSVEKRKC